MTVNNVSGIKGYAISVDGNASGDPGNTINSIDGNFTANLQTGKATYVHAKAIDNAGNASAITNYKYEDLNIPSIDVKNPISGWTNQSISLNASATDAETGVKDIVNPDGSVINANSSNFPVTKNGDYTFKAHDWVGNEISKLITVGNIDTDGPKINLTPGMTGTWTNKGINVSVDASDTQSGVASITLPDGTAVNDSKATFDVTKNGIYTVKSKDNVGNESTQSIPIGGTGAAISIDSTKPDVAVSYDHAYGWSNQNIKVTIKATDKESGVKSISLPDGTEVAGDTASFDVRSNGTYRVTVYDNAGNSTIKDVAIDNSRGDIGIDKLAPDLDVTSDPVEGWSKGFITLTAQVQDYDSGVASLQLPDGTVVTDSTAQIKVYKDGDYKFVAKDIAGNVTEKTVSVGGSNLLKIDNNAPNLTLAVDDTSWSNTDKIIKVTASDDESGLDKIILPDGTETSSASYEFKAGSNGTYEFKAVDKVGNEITKSITINQIDKETPNAPDITGISTSTQDAWVNTDVIPNIGVPTDSSKSGMKEVQYQIIDKATGKIVKDWTTFENGKTAISNEGISLVNFRTLSNAGTPSDTVSITTKIDKTKPSIKANCDNTGWNSTGTAINVDCTDSLSGVDTITLPDGKVVNLDSATWIATTNGTYTFTVKDKAGNTQQVSATVSNVDSKLPSIPNITNIPDNSKTSWRNTDYKPNVVINTADNVSGISNVLYQLVDESTGKIIKDWSNFDLQNTVISNEGVTRVNFKTVSKAGLNSSVASLVTRIDKTKPLLSATNITPSNSLNVGVDYTIDSTDSLSGLLNVTLPTGEQFTSTPVKINISKPGDYKIIAKDIAGNTQECSISVSDNLNSNRTKVQVDIGNIIDKWKPTNDSVPKELEDLVKGYTSDKYNVTINDWKLNPATELTTGNVTGSVTVDDKNGNKITVPFAKEVSKVVQTVESAKTKLDANIGNLTATNDTAKNDVISQISKYITNTDMIVDIEDFDKKNATMQTEGSIIGKIVLKDKSGNISTLPLNLTISKLAETLEDANSIITANIGKIKVDNNTTDNSILEQVKSYIYTDALTPSIKDFKLDKSTTANDGSAKCTIVITDKTGKSIEIPFNGTINKLEDSFEETYARINEHLGELRVTNESTEETVLVQLSRYVRNSNLRLSIKDFSKFKASLLVKGDINGFLTLTNPETNEVKDLKFEAKIPELLPNEGTQVITVTTNSEDLNVATDVDPSEGAIDIKNELSYLGDEAKDKVEDFISALPKTGGYVMASIVGSVIIIILGIAYVVRKK